MMKRCSKCKEYKDISLFRKNRCRQDGLSEYCRDCARVSQSEYKAKHRVIVNAIQSRWSKENKEKINAIQRRYHTNHPETKEKRYATIREWHKQHPESDAESRRKYRIKHSIQMNAYAQNRRARKKGNGGEYTAQEFIELCLEFNNRCACCGKDIKLTVDHIVPIRLGGTNTIENIQPLCQSCNSKKHIEIIDYRDARISNYSTETSC